MELRKQGNSMNSREYFKTRVAAINDIDSLVFENIELAIEQIISTFRSGGKVLICGNGGSAADAQHVAAEFVNGMTHPNTLHLPAIALTTDSSIITSHANDYSFDGIFELQLKALANPQDCVILLTTSGKSLNILKALKYCEISGIASIVISGDTSDFSNRCNVAIKLPTSDTQIAQELTLIVEHFICEKVITGVRSERSAFSLKVE